MVAMTAQVKTRNSTLDSKIGKVCKGPPTDASSASSGTASTDAETASFLLAGSKSLSGSLSGLSLDDISGGDAVTASCHTVKARGAPRRGLPGRSGSASLDDGVKQIAAASAHSALHFKQRTKSLSSSSSSHTFAMTPSSHNLSSGSLSPKSNSGRATAVVRRKSLSNNASSSIEMKGSMHTKRRGSGHHRSPDENINDDAMNTSFHQDNGNDWWGDDDAANNVGVLGGEGSDDEDEFAASAGGGGDGEFSLTPTPSQEMPFPEDSSHFPGSSSHNGDRVIPVTNVKKKKITKMIAVKASDLGITDVKNADPKQIQRAIKLRKKQNSVNSDDEPGGGSSECLMDATGNASSAAEAPISPRQMLIRRRARSRSRARRHSNDGCIGDRHHHDDDGGHRRERHRSRSRPKRSSSFDDTDPIGRHSSEEERERERSSSRSKSRNDGGSEKKLSRGDSEKKLRRHKSRGRSLGRKDNETADSNSGGKDRSHISPRRTSHRSPSVSERNNEDDPLIDGSENPDDDAAPSAPATHQSPRRRDARSPRTPTSARGLRRRHSLSSGRLRGSSKPRTRSLARLQKSPSGSSSPDGALQRQLSSGASDIGPDAALLLCPGSRAMVDTKESLADVVLQENFASVLEKLLKIGISETQLMQMNQMGLTVHFEAPAANGEDAPATAEEEPPALPYGREDALSTSSKRDFYKGLLEGDNS